MAVIWVALKPSVQNGRSRDGPPERAARGDRPMCACVGSVQHALVTKRPA